MSLHGRVHRVTDAIASFAPIILGGNQEPTTGFTAWAGVTVSADYILEKIIPPRRPPKPGLKGSPGGVATYHWGTSVKTHKDGSFQLSEPPASLAKKDGHVKLVMLKVTAGVPVYRTSYMPIAEAKSKTLNIWVFIDTDAQAQGLTAGFVGQQLGGGSGNLPLPSDTVLSAGGIWAPYGLNFVGSTGDDVRINFTLRISPDSSSNLALFFDLRLNGWDIEVDFPDSLWVSAQDLASDLIYGVGAEQGPVNAGIFNFIASVLAKQDGISLEIAQSFLQTEVTVTFVDITYPEIAHSWGLAATDDQTVVLRATPAIGFPRL
jgi:hypothetical protein